MQYHIFMKFSIRELIKATDAEILKGNNEDSKEIGISTDTRTISDDEIYLPLKGENFDGEKLIENSNLKMYFTSNEIITPSAQIALKVQDTKEAYMKLAQYCIEKYKPHTIGVTGSSGKTTTKEIIYSVLSQKFKTHKTFSNHNNEIGFCQTVLGMQTDTEVLIVEMGMRGLGEIELISKYLKPEYAVITNSGSAHVGRLGSVDNIAIAKCEIATGLKPDGIFIANNQEIIKKHVKFSGKKLYYSINDVEIIKKSPSYSKFIYKEQEYELNVEGDYNIENSLPAIQIGKLLGMNYQEICTGLKSYHPIEKRWEVEEIGGNKYINDSYNANPESMKAAVKTFVELYENPVVILGNMGELGENEVEYHKQVGKFLAKLNCNVKYLTVGSLAENIAKELILHGFEVNSFDTNEQVSCYILENLNKSYTIFLKASRSMKFEQILENIKRGINKL